MSAVPVPPRSAGSYGVVDDPEKALKYAVQHIRGDRAELIEGVIEQVPPSWDHETAAGHDP